MGSVSEANFKRASDRRNDPNRAEESPYFGWLSNSLAGYPETRNLKTNVHTRPVGLRPFIELELTDHPLAVEQRDGITLARVIEIAETVVHHNAMAPRHVARFERGACKRLLTKAAREATRLRDS